VTAETSAVVEVAGPPGEVLARNAAAESPARTAQMTPAKVTAHTSAAKPAPHMNAATETASVSTPTVSSSTTTSPARKRVCGQSPESGSRSQNYHGLT
jgi:hypothetical protein